MTIVAGTPALPGAGPRDWVAVSTILIGRSVPARTLTGKPPGPGGRRYSRT